jgi:hypothetical protein
MMRIRATLAAMLLAVVAGTGCEQISETPMSADVVMQASVDNGNGQAKKAYRLARAQFEQAQQTVTQQIGKDGGWLNIGNHYLQVLPGAVNNPTRFTMTLRAGENFIVDLHAARPNGQVVSQFPAGKVYLYMTYQDAIVYPSDHFAIGYLPTDSPEGGIEPQTVIQYPQYNAVGTMLTHFSAYALLVD